MAKKAKPMRTKLLKIVQKGITLHMVTESIIDDMLVIRNQVKKSSFPSEVFVLGEVEKAKELVREIRLSTAREIKPKKGAKPLTPEQLDPTKIDV